MKWFNHQQVNYSQQIIFILIFLGGAFLRFFNLGTVRHGFDEGYPAYDALRFIDAGEWLWVGQPSSIFVDNPPLMAYLQAIPLLIYRSPWSVYIFITLLNTVAIWFVYRTAQEILGNRPGLVAALLFAFSPWVVYFSQLPWHQGLVPFFTSVIAWGLWPILIGYRGSPARFLVGLLAVTGLCLTYVQALGILPQVLLLLLVFRRQIPWRAFMVGSGVFVLGMLVYVYGLSRSWTTSRTNLADLGAEMDFSLTGEGIYHAIRLVTGRDYAASFMTLPAGETWLTWLSTLAHFLLLALLLVGIAVALFSLRQAGKERRIAVVLLVWLLTPVLFTTLSPFPVHPHYLLLTLPAGYVLAAWVTEMLPDRPARPLLVLSAIGLFLLAAINLQRVGSTYIAQPTGPEFNGWTVSAGSELGRTIRDLSGGDPPRRVVANGEAAVVSSLSATYLDTERGIAVDEFVLVPGDVPLLYIQVNRPAGIPLLPPEWQQIFPERKLETVDNTVVEFVRILPVDRSSAISLPEVPVGWTSDAGLSLLGYSIENGANDERSLQITTVWRVEDLHPQRGDWFVGSYYHLRDQGKVLVNLNEHGWPGSEFRVGDVYLERVTIPIPADLPTGRYEVALSLFDPLRSVGFALHSPQDNLPELVVPVDIGEGE